jgi:hypothetical protein
MNDILPKAPNDKYQKFFDKINEINALPISEWKYQHLLIYFCQKYYDTYHTIYNWKFNNPSPSKCFEVWQISVLSSKISAQPKILKEYIDWAFENLIPKAKRRLTSISFMTKEEVVNDYKMNVLWAGQATGNVVDRSTSLPVKYIDILKEQNIGTLTTYGDLAFIYQMDPMPDNIKLVFDKLAELGLDSEVLKRIV